MVNIITFHVPYVKREKVVKPSRREVLARNFNSRPWTEEEKEAMLKEYRRGMVANLAERFGRSYRAVQQQAQKMGITQKVAQ